MGSIIGWGELLKRDRVVLLAEAGAGKSREMEEQALCLNEDQKFSFYVPLECIESKPLADCLDVSAGQRLEEWKVSGSDPGWFFLDSVDELKLKSGNLDRAIMQFSRDISGYLDRARVIISCRPSDWRPSADLATIQKRIPAPNKTSEVVASDPEETFIGAFRRSGNANLHFNQEESEESETNKICTVAMLPMNNKQIMEFAKSRGVRDSDAFLREIDRENAWDFARRPLDLGDLVGNWRKTGRLGTRVEQHETNATTKLRDDPDRPGSNVLRDIDVRKGAEKLALGLALTRTITIASPEQAIDISSTEDTLHADAILPDWTVEQRKSLLRRALFDPATYGRIRFHHRSVQEYLAARRLRGLRDKGMSKKALFRLFFSEAHGFDIVRPSMRAIAAWLALWDADVLRELIGREPEILLSFGDPSELKPDTRERLIRKVVEEYGQGGWRGLEISLELVRRLSRPDLADVIRECWRTGASNVEIHELLIDMIGQARIKQCADLARDTAFDTGGDPRCRIAAVKALVDCDCGEIVRECANGMLTNTASWPNEVVFSLVEDLFPRIISAEELILLIEFRYKEGEDTWNIDWRLSQIAKTINPNSETTIALREKIADLIFRMRDKEPEPYSIRSKFSCFAPALAILCERQISVLEGEPEPALIDACVIASRFGEGEIDTDRSIDKLRRKFDTGLAMRNAAFWSEQSFLEKLTPAGEDFHLFYSTHDSIVGFLQEADRSWLEAVLVDRSCPERRATALHELIGLWFRRDGSSSELDELRGLIKDDEELLQSLLKKTTPTAEDHDFQRQMEEFECESQERKRDNEEQEETRLRTWKIWRKWLIRNPDEAFSSEHVDGTLSTIHLWLREDKQNNFRFNNWNKEKLKQAFGTEVAERAEVEFRAFWRKSPPTLWSERGASGGNNIPQDWILGLLGVSAEASHSGWEKGLTPKDASTAAGYATIELNGFAPFLTDLAVSHPSEVETIIGEEVIAELSVGDKHESLPTLQNLSHADNKLKRLIVPRLIEGLAFVPHMLTADNETKWPDHLDRLLRILAEADNDSDRQEIADECFQRYEANPDGPLATMWLLGLFQFDPLRGTDALISTLSDSSNPADRTWGEKMFAALFGGPGPVLPVVEDRTECARMLGRLVRNAYAFVRREEDIVHKSQKAYTPGARDSAQTARNHLLSRLLETPGPEANRILLELADEAEFAHFPDRLRMLVRRKAAAECDLSPLDPADIVALENGLEAPVRNADGLFSVMMDRLEDLAHDLRHHEFSDLKTVQGIIEESEMRRTLAMRLDAKANGIYKLAQEEEIVDEKRTDIRFFSATSSHKAVIEIKIADNRWSLKQLEKALKNQLVGRYLRHENCKRGCLLLTYAGRRQYWIHPECGKRLSPVDGIDFLREKAKEIEKTSSSDVHLKVFLLDLSEN